MIKYIFLFAILTSCTTQDYIEMPISTYQYIKGADIDISESFIASKKFSFIKIRIGRQIVATMTLSSIEGNIFEWVGSDLSERVFTKNGKIIKTVGLKNNISILNSSEFSLSTTSHNNKHLVHLITPEEGMFYQSYSLSSQAATTLTLENNRSLFSWPEKQKFSNIPVIKIKELFKTQGFRWSGTNTYWLDSKGYVVKSKQSIHQYTGNVEIDFYYKF